MGEVVNRTRTPGYIPNELYNIIREEHEQTGMPMSRIVERLIRKGLEVEKKISENIPKSVDSCI